MCKWYWLCAYPDDNSTDEHWDDEHLVDLHFDNRLFEIDALALSWICSFAVGDRNHTQCPTKQPHYTSRNEFGKTKNRIRGIQIQLHQIICTHNPALARPKPHACDRLSIQKCIPMSRAALEYFYVLFIMRLLCAGVMLLLLLEFRLVLVFKHLCICTCKSYS